MKKAFALATTITLLLVGQSSAVYINWAVSTYPGIGGLNEQGLPGGARINEAVLFYTTLPENFISGASDTPGAMHLYGHSKNPGNAVDSLYYDENYGADPWNSEYASDPQSGSYYVILFANDGQDQFFSVSTTGLVWDDAGGAINNGGPMSPPTNTFDPQGFTNWQPIPEPGTTGLLFAGLATVLLRRRRRA